MDEERREKGLVMMDTKRILLLGFIVFLAVTGSLFTYRAFDSSPALADGYVPSSITTKAWVFAEGHVEDGFDEWILVWNPPASLGGCGETVGVHLAAYDANGTCIFEYSQNFASGQRGTFNINQLMAANGATGDVSIYAYGRDSNGYAARPFIAERAIYFDYGGWCQGGSQTFGYPVD